MIIKSVSFIAPVPVPIASGQSNTAPYVNVNSGTEVVEYNNGILMVAGGRFEWQPFSNVKSVELQADPRIAAELEPAKETPKKRQKDVLVAD